MDKTNKEKGFSLTELLIVVVIIGVVTALAVPALQKGIRAAQNGSTFATLRAISSSQIMFFSQNNRFARLDELQRIMAGGIGVTTGDSVVRGSYVFEMSPSTPTDGELAKEYVITATRSVSDDVVFKYELTQSGKITQILPGNAIE